MKQHQSIARRCAAVTATAALVLGAGSLLAPADAAKAKPLKGKTSGSVLFNCEILGSPFEYQADIVLKGNRATKTTKALKLTATMSDLPGVAPVPVASDISAELKLKVGTSNATLKGTHAVDVPGSTPIPVAPLKGSVKNSKNSLAVTVTSFKFTVDAFQMEGTCTPAEGQGALGTLKIK